MAKRRKRVKIKRENLFENESPPEVVAESENITEEEIDEEEEAIDKLLDGDDSAFDKLEYYLRVPGIVRQC